MTNCIMEEICIFTILVPALELRNGVVDETVIEILATEVSVTNGSPDFEDAFPSGQEGSIKSPSFEIEDKDFVHQ